MSRVTVTMADGRRLHLADVDGPGMAAAARAGEWIRIPRWCIHRTGARGAALAERLAAPPDDATERPGDPFTLINPRHISTLEVNTP